MNQYGKARPAEATLGAARLRLGTKLCMARQCWSPQRSAGCGAVWQGSERGDVPSGEVRRANARQCVEHDAAWHGWAGCGGTWPGTRLGVGEAVRGLSPRGAATHGEVGQGSELGLTWRGNGCARQGRSMLGSARGLARSMVWRSLDWHGAARIGSAGRRSVRRGVARNSAPQGMAGKGSAAQGLVGKGKVIHIGHTASPQSPVDNTRQGGADR